MSPKTRAAFASLFLAATLTAANLGCGGAGASVPTVQTAPISVSLNSTTAMLVESASEQFTATLVNDVNMKGVTWTVSCPASSCGSISPASTKTGSPATYTAPGPPAKDLTVTLTATAGADSTKSASATITVPAISVSLSVVSGTVQVASTLLIGGSTSNDGGSGNLNWTLSQSGTDCSPACGTISPTTGTSTTYAAPITPPASDMTLNVTGTSVTDPTKSGSVSLLVPSVGITVSPAAPTVLGTQKTQLAATLVNDTKNQGVSWSVSCSATACGNISPASTASGAPTTYTAPAAPDGDLQVTATATSVSNSNAVASASITVPAIVVDTEPQVQTVVATTTQQFTATVTNDAANAGVTWSLLLPDASVSCSPTLCGTLAPTSSSSGAMVTYTAPALSGSDLTVSVVATSVTNTANFSGATVTVPAISVSAVTPPSGIVPITGTPQFMATVSYDPTGQGLNWSLSQNGSNCSPACGTMNPASTASPGTSTFNGPATLPTNTTVNVNGVSITDPTKSNSAIITLTNGTVQLIPASLSFSCKPNFGVDPCPPPAQAVRLTNTGGTALNITSIAATINFSESNNCPGSVAPGDFCTISVTFTTKVVGKHFGHLTLTDSSSDSPQQVSLSGTVIQPRLGKAIGARSDLAMTSSASVPSPTGQWAVGTRVLDLVDSNRQDVYAKDGSLRELPIRVWYPISPHSNEACQPAAYTSAHVWQYFAQLVGVPAFPVTTNSCMNATVAEGRHPVILLTPGLTGTFTDYTFLTEDLASRGYIVVAVNHTYEATAVEFSDGRLVRSVVGSHLGRTVPHDQHALAFALDARLKDVKFVLDQIALLNSRHDSPFTGRFDLSKIAVAGHSLGGLTALLMTSDPHVKGAVLIDPVIPDVLPGRTNKPVLILAADRKNWAINECGLWSNLQGPRLAVTLQGTEHAALSDWIWLTKDAVQTGPMGPQKAMSAMRDYVAAFLDGNLRGEPADPLLSGASLNYPDARVTMQGQSLCGMPMESITAPVHPQR